MAKKRKKKNQGRRYEIEEWVEFILDGVADSEGVEDVEITKDLAKEVDRYTSAVDKAVEECSKRFPPTEDIVAGDDVYYDVYQTLSGAGVGIWDGRWDHYYPRNKKHGDWTALIACFKKHVGKFVDEAGGGSLEMEMYDAVYEASGREDNPRKRKKKSRRKNPSKLKSSLLRGT